MSVGVFRKSLILVFLFIVLFCLLGRYILHNLADFKIILEQSQFNKIGWGIFILLLISPIYSLRTFLLLRQWNPLVSYPTVFKIVNYGLALNYIFPAQLGTPGRIYLTQKFCGIPVQEGTGIIGTEFILESFTVWILTLIGLVVLSNPTYTKLFVFCLAVILFGVYFLRNNFTFKLKLWNKWHLGERFGNILNHFMFRVKKAGKKTLSSFFLIVLMSLLMFLLDIVKVNFFIESHGKEFNLLTLLFIAAMARLVGTLSMLPSGLFALDGTLVYFLHQYGMDLPVAITISITNRLLTTLIPIIVAFTFFLWQDKAILLQYIQKKNLTD